MRCTGECAADQHALSLLPTIHEAATRLSVTRDGLRGVTTTYSISAHATAWWQLQQGMRCLHGACTATSMPCMLVHARVIVSSPPPTMDGQHACVSRTACTHIGHSVQKRFGVRAVCHEGSMGTLHAGRPGAIAAIGRTIGDTRHTGLPSGGKRRCARNRKQATPTGQERPTQPHRTSCLVVKPTHACGR